MRVHLRLFIFAALLAGTASLAYGLNYIWFTGSETTVLGERIRYWHGDTLQGAVRSNDCIADLGSPLANEILIMSCDSVPHDSLDPGFHGYIVWDAPQLPFPLRADSLRAWARAQNLLFAHGDTMQARVNIEGDSLRLWWAPDGAEFDPNNFTMHAMPESAVVFFNTPKLSLSGTVSGRLIVGCAGRAGLEDNLLYASSDLNDHGRIGGNHSEKFALVAEGEIKILNTWANGRENSHGGGYDQTHADSTDIWLNGLYFALGGSFTFDQQNDADSGYVYQDPPGTPHTDERGTLWLWGGVAQAQRGYLHRSTNGSTGYLKRFMPDPALTFWRVGVFSGLENRVEPTSINFGNIAVGHSVRNTVLISNDFLPVRIDSAVIAAPFSVALPDSYRWAQQILVTYAPTEAGQFNDTLRFHVQTYDRWFSIPLHGGAFGSQDAPEPQIPQPSVFRFSASPNPFNPVTQIRFALPEAGNVKLEVFDVLGQCVATLRNGFVPAGEHVEILDGWRLAAGIHFARLTTSHRQATLKLVLVK